MGEDFSFFLVAFCRCLRTAIDGWNSERASASESELIGQVENDQRARRVIDRTRATRGEWTDAPVRPEAPDGVHTGQAIESAQYLVSSQSASGELDDMGRRKGLCRKSLRSLT